MPSRTSKLRILLLSSFALALAITASAGEKGPCAGDRQKFCGDVKAGGGARFQCLMEHEAQLTPACKAKVDETKAGMQEVAQACNDDAERLCKKVEPGKGRVMQCLAQQKDKLTVDCKHEVEKVGAKHDEVKGKVEHQKDVIVEACRGDIAKSCAGVQEGEGRILKCLHGHEATLAPACKQALQ